MRIDNIFKFFQPKDKVFFMLFEKVVDNLVEMSKVFNEGIKDFNESDETLLKRLSDYKDKNDQLTNEIFVQLGKNFITPFDREDIHYLASGLDDIADYINAATKYIFLYKSPETSAFGDLSLLIHKACIQIKIAIDNLKEFKNTVAVKEATIKITTIENIADDVHSSAMIKLFETNDPITVIKVSQVLNYLEEITDKAEDVANTIDNIIIKYA